jgi:hypothetical protein
MPTVKLTPERRRAVYLLMRIEREARAKREKVLDAAGVSASQSTRAKMCRLVWEELHGATPPGSACDGQVIKNAGGI